MICILTSAFFCHSDDHDSDSYDTQVRYFETCARELSITLLQGNDAAMCDRIRTAIATEMYRAPEGMTIIAKIDTTGIDVQLQRLAA